MKRLYTTLLIALCFSFVNGYAYVERNLLEKKTPPGELEKIMTGDRKWAPYPAYSDRPAWDRFLGSYKQELIGLGENNLDYQWKVIKATDYLEFQRSGNREMMQKPFNENNQALSSLIMAELAEGKGRFIDQIINGVYFNCEMTSWALSAHVVLQSTGRSLPDFREHVIDLTAGEVGSLLSWTYYYFHDVFDQTDPSISIRLRQTLQERILDTYMNTDRFWWMAFNLQPGGMVNNWNPWCNFNVLQCFMLLENDPGKLAKAAYRTMQSVDQFINYTHADGACEEGPSYWGHAAGKLYDYLQLLHDGAAGKISLFNEPIIKNMGEYISRSYVGNGWVVNFADASAKGGGDAPLVYRYGKAVGSNEMMHYAAYLNTLTPDRQAAPLKLSFGTDLYRGLQSLLYDRELAATAPSHNTPGYTWYPETEFCYMKNKSGFFFASKGGYNDESHNHNDAGTFSLYLNTIPIIIDAGVGTYTRKTFSKDRYSIWTMQSNYHNLPLINGIPQSYGSQFKATDVRFNAGKRVFSANIATAYPEQAAVNKWIRSYTLQNDQLIISDTYDLKEIKESNRINFLSWGKIDISKPGKIILEVSGEKLILSYNEKAFEPSLETIKLDDARLSGVWGEEIYKISLLAKEKNLSGNYQFTLSK